MIKAVKIGLMIFLMGFYISGLKAQTTLKELWDSKYAQNSEEPDLSTPYSTTLYFFFHLEEDNFSPDKASKALEIGKNNNIDAEKLAVRLKQVFEGNGIILNYSQIPDNPDFTDSLVNNQSKYFFDSRHFPQIYLEKKGNEWKFSSHTVSKIDKLYHETYPYGTGRLLNLLPKLGNQVYFGLHFWQLAGIFILVFLLFLSHKLLTVVLDKGLLYFLQRFGYEYLGEKYLLPVAKVMSIYLIIVFSVLFIRVLQLPAEIVAWLIKILNVAKPLVITIVFYKVADIVAMYFSKLAEKTESNLDDQLVPLLRKSLKTLVIIVGTLFVLKDGLEIDIVPFLTGLSIGGLAFALAAQDTIKNFFGSIMIFIDRPFQVGDWITSGEVDGTVEEVGFRSTRIRTFRNSVMYIPNGKIADATIDNHGLRQYRRFYSTLTITYDTSPDLIETFVLGLRKIVEVHPHTRKDAFNIYFNNLSSYSLDVMFYIFFQVPSWQEELRCRHEILIQIVNLANSLGVRFAFPTQTMHMESFPEKKSLAPSHTNDMNFYKARLQEFLDKELTKKDT
jgi:MscS family membrane protein